MLALLAIVLFIAPLILAVSLLDTRGRLKRLESKVVLLERDRANLVRPQVPVEDVVAPLQPSEVPASATEDEQDEVAPVVSVPRPIPPTDTSEDEELLQSLRQRYAALVATGAAPALRSESPEEQIDEMQTALASLDTVEPTGSGSAQTVKPIQPQQKKPAKSGFSFSFEDLFGRQLPIWAGGITLAIAGVLIVKYAIEAKLLSPWARIIGGLLFGVGLIGGAEYAYRKEAKVQDPRVRQALSGAGIATLYASILVAHNVYGLIGPFAAFIAMAVITAGALALSLRFGAPSALLGLAGGLATPALVGSMQPNVPLLSAYLALTVGGLTAVSRRQKWVWLGLSALAGGGIWSLLLIISGNLEPSSAIALGLLVFVLAFALPIFGFADRQQSILRAVAAAIGATQIAILVAMGGFAPLHWGLFILITLASQWLVWRDRRADDGNKLIGLLPVASLTLSILLLLIWPEPSTIALAAVALILLAIHAVPLFPRLWSKDADYPALQWSASGIAFLAVGIRHFDDIFAVGHSLTSGLLATAGAIFTLIPVATGWHKVRTLTDENPRDNRFAVLIGAAGLLACAACGYFVRESWLGLAIASVALALLFLVNRAGKPQASLVIPGIYALIAFLYVPFGAGSEDELSRLIGFDYSTDWPAFLRWALPALILGLFSINDSYRWTRIANAVAASLLAYGALAQIIPSNYLPVAAALMMVGLAFLSGKRSTETDEAITTSLIVYSSIAILWGANAIMRWLEVSGQALAGMPLEANALPTATQALTYLAVPAALAGVALWQIRPRIGKSALASRIIAAASVTLMLTFGIAVHILYRHGFASIAGHDFVSTGMAQRAVWAAILIGLGWLLLKRGERLLPDKFPGWALPAVGTAYLGYFSYALHNPLWAEQAVGGIPLANMLIPTFAIFMGGLWLVEKEANSSIVTRIVDMVRAFAIIIFSYQTLGQAFHGSLLYPVEIGEFENIMQSILAIALAVGFLLWGIRTKKRDWRIASLVLMLLAVGKVFLFDASGLTGLIRIASFVALGFSLIGIGWLYSRQLRGGSDDDMVLTSNEISHSE